MPEETKGFFKKFGQTLLTWVTVIASLATISGLYLQTRDGPPHITATIDSRDLLTTPAIESNLKASYLFDGKEVKDLWKLRITMRHDKGQTVVGAGPKQNVIGDHLPIKVSAPCEILAINVEQNDPTAVVTKVSSSEVSLKFDQWRKDERITVVLYLEANSTNQPSPNIFSSGRALIDGEVAFQLPEKNNGTSKRILVDYLPPAIALTARIFLALLSAALLIAGAYGLSKTIKDRRKEHGEWEWYSQYGAAARKHLATKVPEGIYALLEAESFIVTNSTFVRLVGKSFSELWIDFKGDPPSSLMMLRERKAPSTSEFAGAIIGVVTVTVIALLSLAVTWAA